MIATSRGMTYCDDCARDAANVSRIYASEAVMSQLAVEMGFLGKERVRQMRRPRNPTESLTRLAFGRPTLADCPPLALLQNETCIYRSAINYHSG